MKLTPIFLFALAASFFNTNITAQTTDSLLNKHKKNIFTLAFYKQPGKDSMVDVVDGLYRVFKFCENGGLVWARVFCKNITRLYCCCHSCS